MSHRIGAFRAVPPAPDRGEDARPALIADIVIPKVA
jgi:hypothetical protein